MTRLVVFPFLVAVVAMAVMTVPWVFESLERGSDVSVNRDAKSPRSLVKSSDLHYTASRLDCNTANLQEALHHLAERGKRSRTTWSHRGSSRRLDA